MPDHYQDDKNIVKALLSAGAKVYADYQEAALASDMEADARHKEMRKFNLDQAKLKLDSQMNTIRGYTALLQQKMQARKLSVEEGKLKSEDDKTKAFIEGIDAMSHLSDEDKQIAKILYQAGQDPSAVIIGEEETAHQKFFRSLEEVYPGDDEAMVAKRQTAKEQYIEKLINIPSKDENEIQQKINIAREVYKDNPEKMQQAIDKILIGTPKVADDELSEIGQAQKDHTDIDKWEAEGTISPERAAKLRRAVDIRLGLEPKATATADRDPQSGEVIQGIMDKYEPGTPTRRLIEGIASLIKTDDAEANVLKRIDALVQGATSPEDIDENMIGDVLEILALNVNQNLDKGEVIEKLSEAQAFTAYHLPDLWDEYNQMIENGLKTGKIEQLEEGVHRFLGGTDDPEFAAFNTRVNMLVNAWVRTESGAAVLPEEITRLQSFLPSTGNNLELNVEIFRTLADFSIRNGARGYIDVLGDDWGQRVADHTLAETQSVLDEVNKTYPKYMSEGQRNAKSILDEITGETDDE